MRFSNRIAPLTEEDFAEPPGIIPGRRLPDHCYLDEKAPEKAPQAVLPAPTPAEAIKAPGRGASARGGARETALQPNLFDF